MTKRRALLILTAPLVLAAAALAWHANGAAQAPAAAPARFEFDVVESFDAQYLGDTPGHIGRGGSLGKTVPYVAVGDPVYRGATPVGHVSRATWDRAKESLEVEFDPIPGTRITVGDSVWVALGNRADAAKPGPP